MKLNKNEALVLRTCNKDMEGHGSFKWPKKGVVKAPDWKPTKECGNGLHGLLWGEGNGQWLDWSADAVWLVVKVKATECIDLDDKVKFPFGVVVYAGDRKTATDMIAAVRPGKIVGAFFTGGDRSTLTGGDRSTLTGGDGSTLTGGDRSTLTGGNRSTLTGGDRSTLTGGDGSTLIFRHWDGNRWRFVVGYIGEDGLEEMKKYKLSDDGKRIVGA